LLRNDLLSLKYKKAIIKDLCLAEFVWKGEVLVNRNSESFCLAWLKIMLFAFVMIALGWTQSGAQNDCETAKAKWDQAFQDLRDKVQEFLVIQQTPVERVIQRPVINSADGKPIARQVGEALQKKEDVLNLKRKECRALSNLEGQAFNDLQACASGRTSKDKEFKNLTKKRQNLVDKVAAALVEVREVEGKEGHLPYSETMQDPYTRSVNNQLQNYQQMYRRWWGQ
jgi:hypothetical protein